MDKDIKENLAKSASAPDFINDFVHSKNKIFKGHSKKERIKQALAAYYSKKEEREMNDKKDIKELSDNLLSRYSQKALSDIESRGLKTRETFIDNRKNADNMIKKNLKRVKSQELADTKVRNHNNMDEENVDEGKTFKDRVSYGDRKSENLKRALKKGFTSRQTARTQKLKSRMDETEMAWRKKDGNPEQAEVHHFNIYQKALPSNGNAVRKVGEAKTKKGAGRSVDKRDNDYGGYAHYHKPVFADTMHEDNINEISKDLADRYFDKGIKDNINRMKDINNKNSTDYNKNKSAIKNLLAKHRKRSNSMSLASDKANGASTVKVPATNKSTANEDIVNEISRSLANSYREKANKDNTRMSKVFLKKMTGDNKDSDGADKLLNKMTKRDKYIAKVDQKNNKD